MSGPDVTPRPNVLLAIFSWLVVVACICLGSLGIASIVARTWDPCTWVAGIIFASGALLIGSVQYRGTFRHDRNAATFSMVILFGCGGFLLFAVVMCSGEFLIKEWELPPVEMLATAGGVALLVFPAAWLNLRWSRQLSRATAPPVRRPWQLSLQELLIFTAAAGLSLAIIAAGLRDKTPEIGEHVETNRPPLGIPHGATDICWHQYPRGTEYFEFNADEAVFREWVQRYVDAAPRQVPKEIRIVAKAEPLEIYTYKVRVPLTDPGGMVTVTDGLAFSWYEEDRGVHAVWERPTKRVYFNTHSH
jgi:hypothetical protein